MKSLTANQNYSIKDYLDKVIPGNYWLTKSMEFNKVNSSGTLWYLKKWMVYYKFLFMKDELHLDDYATITKIFDEFILSLPLSIQQEAKAFFYIVDIRNTNSFIGYQSYVTPNKPFKNNDDKVNFIREAKKFYFMYLMDIGGQGGFKEDVKNAILNLKNHDKVRDFIENILAPKQAAKKDKTNLYQDFHASLRNERQLFFYYGFFHGDKAKDLNGFYSMTEIGQSILSSNFTELVVIWEHQKLKVLSQTPVSDIQKVNIVADSQYFSINFSPYYDLLRVINKNEHITTNAYRYILSKTKNTMPLDDNIIYFCQDNNAINEFKEKVESLGRESDKSNEDFQKEIKKYILGISNLPKDNNSNPFASLSYISKNKIEIINRSKFDFTFKVYSIINNFKLSENKLIFDLFEQETRTNYEHNLNRNSKSENYKYDKIASYKYDYYLITFNKYIILFLMYWAVCMRLERFTGSLDNEFISEANDSFPHLIKYLGIKPYELKALLTQCEQKYINEDFQLSEIELDSEESLIDPSEIYKLNTLEQLDNITMRALQNDSIYLIKRVRNATLIKGMRGYYINQFADSTTKLVKCDCCNKETFLTQQNIAYLEFHHLIPFAESGADHYLNLFGICPECHRKLHFASKEQKIELYKSLDVNNRLNKTIEERLNLLFEKKLLSSINLDFLYKENIIEDDLYKKYRNNTAYF